MNAPALADLLDTWQRWSHHSLLTAALTSAAAKGDTAGVEHLRRSLDREPPADPLQALAANHELTSLLRGWQWHAIRAAREAGATWDQIGTAVGADAAAARADYVASIELAERYGGDLTDTAPYRAVLDDPPSCDRPVGGGPTVSSPATGPTGGLGELAALGERAGLPASVPTAGVRLRGGRR